MQRCQLRLWSVYDPGVDACSDVSHIPEACHSPSADSPQGCQQVSPSPGRASVVQVGSLPGWRTRPKGGGCELECVGIGTLSAAPGVSTGSTEVKGTTSGVGRGEGKTAAVEAGAALVFPVTLNLKAFPLKKKFLHGQLLLENA